MKIFMNCMPFNYNNNNNRAIHRCAVLIYVDSHMVNYNAR